MHHLHFDDIQLIHNLSESTIQRPQTCEAEEQIFVCFTPSRSVSLMSFNRKTNIYSVYSYSQMLHKFKEVL